MAVTNVLANHAKASVLQSRPPLLQRTTFECANQALAHTCLRRAMRKRNLATPPTPYRPTRASRRPRGRACFSLNAGALRTAIALDRMGNDAHWRSRADGRATRRPRHFGTLGYGP